mmetsp:Transcript_27479/g.40372  ORF Transcript_27479/g.40372 Transcript_27479/m.40372 type:complete len:242 (-) Transcript_27479:697-1422(-)
MSKIVCKILDAASPPSSPVAPSNISPEPLLPSPLPNEEKLVASSSKSPVLLAKSSSVENVVSSENPFEAEGVSDPHVSEEEDPQLLLSSEDPQDSSSSGGGALVSSLTASPNKADGDSESTPSSLIMPDVATVACRSASTAASVAATISSAPSPPPATASPAAPAAAASPAPAAPSSAAPPPPMPIGIPMGIPPPLGTRRAISEIMRSGGIPCNHTVPGPVSVVTNNPSPPNITFLNPGII